MTPDARQVLMALSAHLAERRGAMVARWRAALRADESLPSGHMLPRTQLDDHVPLALAAFERELRAMAGEPGPDPSSLTDHAASAHGMHRWQQGYDLHEVTRELGHLNLIVVHEIDAFALQQGLADSGVMAKARLSWAQSHAANVELSTTQYFRLRQLEAEGHVKDLERALAEVTLAERQRAELWEQLAHDLRGNVGVVATATRGLGLAALPPERRDNFVRLLEQNVNSLRHLLDDVTSLARLQAGHERRELAPCDVSALLTELCEGLSTLATDRGLVLRWPEAAPALVVPTDAVKLRRLVQNLVINAIKYTEVGSVEVDWSVLQEGEGPTRRWRIRVEDSGPGIHEGPGAPLAAALHDATRIANAPVSPVPDAGAPHEALARPAAGHEAAPSARQVRGEGIGLSIVKRLADLLDATIELDSEAGVGTEFRVLLPLDYLAG